MRREVVTVELIIKAEKRLRIGRLRMLSPSAPCSRARIEWIILCEPGKIQSTTGWEGEKTHARKRWLAASTPKGAAN